MDWPLCPPDKVEIGFLGHRIDVHPDAVGAFRLVDPAGSERRRACS